MSAVAYALALLWFAAATAVIIARQPMWKRLTFAGVACAFLIIARALE